VLRTETAAWLMTGVFAGVAGLLLGDLVRLAGTFLTFLVIPAIAAAILGQLRSLWGAALAGLAIGMVEAGLTPVAGLSAYRSAAPFAIALLAVVVLGSSKSALKDR